MPASPHTDTQSHQQQPEQQQPEEEEAGGEEGEEVRCPCGCNEVSKLRLDVSYYTHTPHSPLLPLPLPLLHTHSQDDGLMILCGLCKVWQHAVCFALLTEEEVPELHICEQCSSDHEGEGQPCTDPFLQFLSPVALQVRVCLHELSINLLLLTQLVGGGGQRGAVGDGLACVCGSSAVHFSLSTGHMSLETSTAGMQ